MKHDDRRWRRAGRWASVHNSIGSIRNTHYHPVQGATAVLDPFPMFSNQQAEVALNVPLRTLKAVRGDKSESRFLAGSCSMMERSSTTTNHLHLLRFHSELNQVGHEALLEHPTGAVSRLCTSPADKTVVLTVAEDSADATLWKIPSEVMEQTSNSHNNNMGGYDDNDDDNDEFPMAETATLEERAVLKSGDDGCEIVDLQWRGGAAGDDEHSSSPMGDVLTLDRQGRLTQWDTAFGAAESTRNISTDVSQALWSLPPRMAWDPHSADATAVAAGTHVQLVDWRADTSVPEGTVQRFPCHRYGVTDLDYNPNKPHVLTTAGQEGLIKFWDLRNAKQPLLTVRGGHRHWATQVSYNPFHDQLVMSAGTDSIVNLWRISSISSAPLLTLDDDDDDHRHHHQGEDPTSGGGGSNATGESPGPNVRVSRLEHMDSVYATAWGAADAWIYASAGYDGKVVVNHVPSKEKYKILL
jgi:WD40 repeat protein